MAADLHGDLPPAALVNRRPVSQHWSVRLRDGLSTYLPLLLMVFLAGATWWLVRVTPVPPLLTVQEPSPQTPDYTLQGVDLQRYGGDGLLLARIRGRELRHYPQGDRMELDEAHIVLNQPGGAIQAHARRAEVSDRGDRVRLIGGVVVSRAATVRQAAFEIRGEEVEFEVPTSRAWSVQPVEWIEAGTVVEAAGFEYREPDGRVRLTGPVRARWQPPVLGGR